MAKYKSVDAAERVSLGLERLLNEKKEAANYSAASLNS